MTKITVVGLGYIGTPTAVTFAEAGFSVTGYDINEKTIDNLSSGKLNIYEPGLEEAFKHALDSGMLKFEKELSPSDVFIISVPTPFSMENGKPVSDISFVMAAAREIGSVLKKGNLVVLESTVPPKTTDDMSALLEQVSGISRSEFFCAHCPERIIPGRMLYELKNNDRIIGATSKEAGELAKGIYQKILENGKIHLTDAITAEMCKLAENTFRDINIAYANELSMICDKAGIDVFELIELANCHPRVNILNPGIGVGGHCIAIDPWFLCDKFPDEAQVIKAARCRNDQKPFFVADKAEKELNYDKSKTIAVLGLAFKPDIDDFRQSPSVIFAKELLKRGYKVIACEPFSKNSEVCGITNIPDIEECISKCDYSVIATGHTIFKQSLDIISSKPFYDCIGMS